MIIPFNNGLSADNQLQIRRSGVSPDTQKSTSRGSCPEPVAATEIPSWPGGRLRERERQGQSDCWRGEIPTATINEGCGRV